MAPCSAHPPVTVVLEFDNFMTTVRNQARTHGLSTLAQARPHCSAAKLRSDRVWWSDAGPQVRNSPGLVPALLCQSCSCAPAVFLRCPRGGRRLVKQQRPAAPGPAATWVEAAAPLLKRCGVAASGRRPSLAAAPAYSLRRKWHRSEHGAACQSRQNCVKPPSTRGRTWIRTAVLRAAAAA